MSETVLNTLLEEVNCLIDIFFSLDLKQAILLIHVSHFQIHWYSKPVLSNESKVSGSRKQQDSLLVFKPIPDRHLLIESQSRLPLRQATLCKFNWSGIKCVPVIFLFYELKLLLTPIVSHFLFCVLSFLDRACHGEWYGGREQCRGV